MNIHTKGYLSALYFINVPGKRAKQEYAMCSILINNLGIFTAKLHLRFNLKSVTIFYSMGLELFCI